jgi:hypothetical protein
MSIEQVNQEIANLLQQAKDLVNKAVKLAQDNNLPLDFKIEVNNATDEEDEDWWESSDYYNEWDESDT